MTSEIVATCKTHGDLTLEQTRERRSGYKWVNGCHACILDQKRRSNDRIRKAEREDRIIMRVDNYLGRYGKEAVDKLLSPYQGNIIKDSSQWQTNKPNKSGSYIITIVNDKTHLSMVCQAYYNTNDGRMSGHPKWNFIGNELNWTVTAWKELPEPYEAGV